jgi:hypothetical protein
MKENGHLKSKADETMVCGELLNVKRQQIT